MQKLNEIIERLGTIIIYQPSGMIRREMQEIKEELEEIQKAGLFTKGIKPNDFSYTVKQKSYNEEPENN